MSCEDCYWLKNEKCMFSINIPGCAHKHVRMVDRKELSLLKKLRIRFIGPKKAFSVVVNKKKGEPLDYYYGYCEKH